MIILFPKRKGIKIATTIIFEAFEKGASATYLLGMIHFASAFGAITKKEEEILIQYIDGRES